MGFLDIFRPQPAVMDTVLQESGSADELEFLQERLADLELALEDVGWMRLGFEGEREFSREGLDKIVELSRMMYLSNPLINRGCEVQRLYVFGQGVNVRVQDERVNELVQKFLKANKTEFKQKELGQKEIELQVTGNLFTALFANVSTGAVRVRSIPVEDIRSIISNPDDAQEPWYYLRAWTDVRGRRLEALYPDWEYRPAQRPTLYTVAGRTYDINWDVCIHHVKVGGFRHMRFGVPETYSGLDWARAYKEFLEDWATIVRSYARFAWKRTVKGGKAGVAQAKDKMGSSISSSSAYDTNPPPAAGAMAILAEGNDLTPIKTSGATTSAEDGRRMLLMVAASVGLPETFFGDASVGSLATAESLDRPTQLKMVDRQHLWTDYLDELVQYAIEQAMAAPSGPLPATLSDDDRHLDIDFPPVLERSVDRTIDAIVAGATLDGKTLAGTMDLPTVARLVLTALGEDDVDELLAELFPEGWEEDQPGAEAQESFVEAVRTLREAVADLARD
jgi:hypothetical protein